MTDKPRRSKLHHHHAHGPGQHVAEQTPSPWPRRQPSLRWPRPVCRVAHRQVDVEACGAPGPRQPASACPVGRVGGQVPGVAAVLLDEDHGILLGVHVERHGELAGVGARRVEATGLLRGQRELVDCLEVVVPQCLQQDGVGVDADEITVPARRWGADRVSAWVGHPQTAAEALVRHVRSFTSRGDRRVHLLATKELMSMVPDTSGPRGG